MDNLFATDRKKIFQFHVTGDDIVKEKGVYDALSIDKIDKKLEEMAEIAMDHPYATWPSVLALAVLVLTCIICVVRRKNFKKPTKTYVYKPLLDQEGTRFSFKGTLTSDF